MRSVKLSRLIGQFALLFLISLFCSNVVLGQDRFEGKIVYSIQYLSLSDNLKGMEFALPSETTIYIKGSKVRTEMDVAYGKQIIILDKETKTGLMLMDMMGMKIAITMSKEDIEEEEKGMKDIEVTYLNEFKKIAGYKCQKGIINSEDEEGEPTRTEVYITEKIPNVMSNLGNLKGFALEYTVENRRNEVSDDCKYCIKG